jgi:hypothetical protein
MDSRGDKDVVADERRIDVVGISAVKRITAKEK